MIIGGVLQVRLDSLKVGKTQLAELLDLLVRLLHAGSGRAAGSNSSLPAGMLHLRAVFDWRFIATASSARHT